MKNKVLILIALFFISVSGFAQVDRSKKPQPGPAPEIKLGTYETFTLKNGLKVFVVTNDKIPQVSFSLVLDHDPVIEGDDAGYVTMAGQLLGTATTTRTKDQIDEAVDFIGANLSTSSGGVFASSLTKHKTEILDIMSDVVLNPVFKQDELDKIKKQMLSNLAASKDDPSAIANRVSNLIFYGKDHPYGEMTTEETVNNVNLDMCKKYYDTYFHPNAAYLAIVGDITKADAQKLAEKYFGKWKAQDIPQSVFPTPKAPIVNKVELVNRANSVQSVLKLGYPIELKKGSEDVIKASVMNTILGGSFASRINKNLRETHGYTYGAGSSLNSDKYMGEFVASSTVRNAVTDSAIQETLNELKRIRSDKVDADELDLNKNYMAGSFVRSLERPQTIANFAISIARYDLPKDYYKNYLKNLSAVTADDVLMAAKKYIKPNNMYLVVVGNADEIAKSLNRFSITGKIDYLDIYGNPYDPNMKKVPEGVTVSSVLDKYVEAIGGKENILKVKDRVMKMKGSVQGMDVLVTLSQKYPNKMYQEVDVNSGMMTQKMIFNGEKGISEAMGQTTEITGDQLDMLKGTAMDAMLDYSKYGITPELVGIETIDGKDTYKVTLTSKSGSKSTNYYSVDTGLIVRSVSQMDTQQGSVTRITDMSDYRDVEGMKYPFKISQSFGPQSLDMTVESIEINKGLEDSLFEVK